MQRRGVSRAGFVTNVAAQSSLLRLLQYIKAKDTVNTIAERSLKGCNIEFVIKALAHNAGVINALFAAMHALKRQQSFPGQKVAQFVKSLEMPSNQLKQRHIA